ncbi:MAG: SDR family oxidoreductase [Bacteroidota bacterium]
MNPTALITGASGGIGYELAWIFAGHQYDLVLVARNEKKLVALKTAIEKQHQVTCHIMTRDLSDFKEVEKVVLYVKNRNISIDCLVNNAGFGDFGLFTETQWEKESEMIRLNITALTYLTKELVKEMVRNKSGRIMNVASTAAFQPGPLMAVYYATKSFVLSFSEAIAEEVKGTGVTVTTLCPGPTASGFQSAADLGNSKLVKGKKMPSSKEVAEFGFNAMMKGKRVVIHGMKNRLLAASVRFTPRKMITSMVRKMSERVK